MGSTQTAPTSAKGKSPKIPMPTGDVRKTAPKPGDAPTIQIGKAESFKMDNGLTVIVVENHKLPTVSYRIFVDSDPVLEKDAIGYVEMMGDLLAKGTKTRTKAQIDEEVDFIGASMSSSANGVSGRCLSKHSDKLLTLMSDVLLNPVFPEAELEKSRQRQASGLAQSKNSADAISANVASVLRYGKSHPYGEVMTEATLNKISLDQIKTHYTTFFKPNISYLVILGDITKVKAEKYAKEYFGKWQQGEAPKMNYGIPRPPEKTQVSFVHKPGAVQSVVSITYPVELQPGQPDVIRARLMNTILGGYFNSRVNANLREGHGWTYGAGTALTEDELVGYFNASASVRNAVTDSSIIEFIKELNRMRTEKVAATELQVVKNVMTGQFSQSLEQPGTVANFALNIARFGLPADYYEKYLENLQQVNADEVMSMAKKYIRPDRANILVVGNNEEVADRLKQFSADGKVNFYDAYGDPVKMNSATLPAGMTAEKVIEDYLNAIGGSVKIMAIKDLQMTSSIKMRGPELLVKTWQKGGTKLATEMSMNGQTISKRVYDGSKAMESGMGGATRALEGEELEDLKEQAAFCKEAGYKAGGYKLTLTGIEEIDGKNAYVIQIVRADGKKSTDYYDIKTSLKVREVSLQPGQTGEMVEMTTDYSDYKETSGVLFPNIISIAGIMPVPMKGSVTQIKANEGIDDAVFKLQ